MASCCSHCWPCLLPPLKAHRPRNLRHRPSSPVKIKQTLKRNDKKGTLLSNYQQNHYFCHDLALIAYTKHHYTKYKVNTTRKAT